MVFVNKDADKDSEEKAQNTQNSQEDMGHWLKEAIPNWTLEV